MIARIKGEDLIIFEGIAKNGKNAGKPYAFVKLDRRFSNDANVVALFKSKGVRVVRNDGTGKSTGASAVQVEVED